MEKRLKIALIRKNYSPYGGAENYLKLTAKELKARGNDVHIFSAGQWPEKASLVHKIPAVKKPSFLSNISFALNGKKLLKGQHFDCVLSFERTLYQDIYRAGDGCHKEWLNQRKKVEPFYKGLSFLLNPHHLILLYLEKQCFSNSKIIIANSAMVKKDIIKYYSIPDEKIRVVYNGVDLRRFKPVKGKEKTAIKDSLRIREGNVVLFVGSDFKRKGLINLLNAFSMIEQKDKRLIVVGKGKKDKYLHISRRLGIDSNVTFRGPEHRIERLYAISDVFVLPTIYDPFSNAALEAMASGIPVVSTSHNGASELIENGVQGFVVNDPFDAKSLAEKISTILLQAEDMGKKARVKAAEYSIKNAIDEITEIITSIHS